MIKYNYDITLCIDERNVFTLKEMLSHLPKTYKKIEQKET